MRETLFTFDERNYRDCQQCFRGRDNREYYLGDYLIEEGSRIDVRADRKQVGMCSIIRMQARSRQFFRRSWWHIREDGTDVTVLWFVKRGSLAVTHSGGYTLARAGDFTITHSQTPFAMECGLDERGCHEVLHVLVPGSMFRQYFPREVQPGFKVSARGREFAIAERLLREVFEDGDELADHIERLLLDSALSVLTDGLKGREGSVRARPSLTEQRLGEVLRFIEQHLSDPQLSAGMVARACGISPRYLSQLLNRHGKSFPDLVRERRLELAGQWLASTEPGDITIAEIAYRVGFKSPAHFSRLFKRVYRMGPREFRSSEAADAVRQREAANATRNLYTGSADSLRSLQ